jgi:hypothetical protein
MLLKDKEAQVDHLRLLLEEKEDILKSWISRYEAEIEKIQAAHKEIQRSLLREISSLKANMSLMLSFHSKQNDESAQLVQGPVIQHQVDSTPGSDSTPGDSSPVIQHQVAQPFATRMYPQSAVRSPRQPEGASGSSGATGVFSKLSNVFKVRSASAPSSRHPSPSLSRPFVGEIVGMHAQDTQMAAQMPVAQDVESMRQLNQHLSALLLGLSPPKHAFALERKQSLQDLEAARQAGQSERDLGHFVGGCPDVSVRRATEPQLTLVRPLLAIASGKVHRVSPHRAPRGVA